MKVINLISAALIVAASILIVGSFQNYKTVDTIMNATVVALEKGENINLATTIITGSVPSGVLTAEKTKVFLKITDEKEIIQTVAGDWFLKEVHDQINLTGKFSGKVKVKKHQEFFKNKEITKNYFILSLEK
jgi:hypothetical protein